MGFTVEGRMPVREGVDLVSKESGKKVGSVTSGSPAPSLGKNIGMAYVDKDFAKLKTELVAIVRDKEIPVKISKMPFVPANYYKPAK